VIFPDIKALALDLGNVLVKVDHFRFCRRLGDLAGLTAEEVYARVFESNLEPGYDTGRLTSEEFHYRVTAHFGVNLPFSQFSAWWNDLFEPMEGMADLVRHLATKYPLYLVSNTNASHFAYVKERFALLQHFHRFILSFEVGSRKPEPEIYQALILQTGLPPPECLFVDDKAPFVEAAHEQGLTAWQFTSPEMFIGDLKRRGLY
jgi:HAD superfamily hydrolase (TIGR01509 family)